MYFLNQVIQDTANLFQKYQIERSWREARLLVSFVTGVPYTELIQTQSLISSELADRIKELALRRANREPLTKIIEQADFWKDTFVTTYDTLDPRPESELMIESLCHFANSKKQYRLLDIGTGTGCLLLSGLKELPFSTGIGIDQSVKAIKVAEKNAARLNLGVRSQFIVQDWKQGLPNECFDYILCNPPYVATTEEKLMNPEALFDPDTALFAGFDGLQAYREILPQISLTKEGLLFLEIGKGQSEKVCTMLTQQALTCLQVVNDYQNIPRLLVCCQSLS